MLISDWSSDVCSSDLIRLLENYSYQPLLIAALADDNAGQHGGSPPPALLVRLNRLALKQRNFVFERLRDLQRLQPILDRKSVVSGKSVSVSVDLGGRRIMKNKKRQTKTYKNMKQ